MKKGSLGIDKDFKNLDLNENFKKALDLIETTSKNVFITGKAGTGKSTLLYFFTNKTKKNVVVLAPTGVAALNVKGQTIHSFFQFKPDITLEKVKKVKSGKMYKKIDAIIIDEISMVRADLVDCMDKFLRLNGKDKKEKFGGIQMIFIGDLYQLEPVLRNEEKQSFNKKYETPYFFSSKVFSNFDFEYIELEKIYRQKDLEFINILNSIRENYIDYNSLNILNKAYDKKIPKNDDFYIYLTTTNILAENINNKKLEELKDNLCESDCMIKGDIDEKSFPTNKNLYYKKGAQIMMLNNDSMGRWVNGSIGIIKRIEPNPEGEDLIIIELDNGDEVEVLKHIWDVYKYEFNKEAEIIESKIAGSFIQYPFKLAWAITIHKSQGKTFDKVIINLGSGTFAHGQLYVALSRCTNLDGIILKTKINKRHILLDNRVDKFLKTLELKIAEENLPIDERIKIIENAIKEEKELNIKYLRESTEKVEINIVPKTLKEMEYKKEKYMGFKGYCKDKKCNLTFKINRILNINNN